MQWFGVVMSCFSNDIYHNGTIHITGVTGISHKSLYLVNLSPEFEAVIDKFFVYFHSRNLEYEKQALLCGGRWNHQWIIDGSSTD